LLLTSCHCLKGLQCLSLFFFPTNLLSLSVFTQFIGTDNHFDDEKKPFSLQQGFKFQRHFVWLSNSVGWFDFSVKVLVSPKFPKKFGFALFNDLVLTRKIVHYWPNSCMHQHHSIITALHRREREVWVVLQCVEIIDIILGVTEVHRKGLGPLLHVDADSHFSNTRCWLFSLHLVCILSFV